METEYGWWRNEYVYCGKRESWTGVRRELHGKGANLKLEAVDYIVVMGV